MPVFSCGISLGSGFGTNCSQLEVLFGSALQCEISNCTENYIECTTRRKITTHTITNAGSHSRM